MSKEITPEQMSEQKEFMLKIKEINMRSAAQGTPKLALTQTYGCQQNENDTERIRGMLAECGFQFTDDPEVADVIVYNTCAVRENAEQKVFGRLGILKHMSEKTHDAIICMCGCMVQQKHIAEEIQKKHNQVDLIFGTHALYRFPKLLFEAMNSKKTVIDIEDCDGYIAEDIPVMHENSYKAWVSIMFGCNNFCSYCIVPYVRGRERSRKPELVIDEIKKLVDGGCTEICLLGQNVNSYGRDLDDDVDFADLLKMVNDIKGIKRIRFMTSHPKDISDKLIDTMAECDKVCHQLHLPFQAGSDKILSDMNRKYTKADYLEKINKVKAKIPDISLSTDVIVGFPTETCEDFEETLDVLRKVEFDGVYSFIYSRREGTPAAKLDFVLTDEQIHQNFNKLLDVQNGICLNRNKALVGQTVEVLVDGISKNNAKMVSARLDSNKVINFEGDESLIGKYVQVKVTQAHTWNLLGELTSQA